MAVSGEQSWDRPPTTSSATHRAQCSCRASASTEVPLVWRGPILDFLEKEESPLSSGAFTGTIAAEAVSAVVLFVAASGLMRGSKGIRLLVAIVQGLAMVLAMYILVAHHVGGYMYRAVFALFVWVFVLWALYVNNESDEFFDSEWA